MNDVKVDSNDIEEMYIRQCLPEIKPKQPAK